VDFTSTCPSVFRRWFLSTNQTIPIIFNIIIIIIIIAVVVFVVVIVIVIIIIIITGPGNVQQPVNIWPVSKSSGYSNLGGLRGQMFGGGSV
jgi:hypothetical protein